MRRGTDIQKDGHTHRETGRQIEEQTERQIDRQTYRRETDRQIGKQTERQKEDRQKHRTDRQTDRRTIEQIDRQIENTQSRGADRHNIVRAERQTDRQGAEWCGQTDKEQGRMGTHRETERLRDCAGVVDDLDIDHLRVALNLQVVGELIAADEAFHNSLRKRCRSGCLSLWPVLVGDSDEELLVGEGDV